jgi:hypothetical protein
MLSGDVIIIFVRCSAPAQSTRVTEELWHNKKADRIRFIRSAEIEHVRGQSNTRRSRLTVSLQTLQATPNVLDQFSRQNR